MTEAHITASDLPPDVLRLSTERAAAANSPTRVTPTTALLVRQGELDLFAEDISGAVDGRRHLIGTLGPGTLLWTGPAAVAPPGWAVTAVGHPTTRLVDLPADALAAALTPAELARHAESVTAAMTGTPIPRPDQAVADPSKRLAEARQIFRRTVEETVEQAHRRSKTDAARIYAITAQQDGQLASTLQELAEVVDAAHRAGAAADQPGQLRLALRCIGQELGHDLGGDLPRAGGSDPVFSALRASGCRWRVVTLEDGWWQKPGTPLLGFMGDGRVPVALLPHRTGHLLYDPASGEASVVDAAAADRVSRAAYVIYPPLTADITPRGLLRTALWQVRGELMTLAAFGVLAGLITLITPLVVALVFDRALPAQAAGLLAALTGLLVGAAVSWALVVFTQNTVSVRLMAKLAVLLDPAVIDRLLRLPAAFLRNFDTGDLAMRAGVLQLIRQQLAGGVLSALLLLLFSGVNLLVLFAYSPLLGVVSLAVVIGLLVVLLLLNVHSLTRQTAMYTEDGHLSSMLYQVVAAIDKVRAAGAERRLMTRWAVHFRRREREAYAAGRIQASITALTAAVPSVLGLTLYAVVTATMLGQLSSGQFLAVTASLGQFTAALNGMTLTIGPLLSIIPLWGRLSPLLTEPAEQVGSEDPGTISGQLSLRAVSFGYGEPTGAVGTARRVTEVLSDIDLDVQPGQFLAITGPSGSGKSTLLRLMLGLDEPTSGVIRYDGADLKALDVREVRRQAGVVVQNARPLPGQLLTTILGTGGGTEADAWEAAEGAGLADDIRRMPMKMHTIVGEGGATFSGGQLQRLMIARALARKPRIIFFDEATSALDDRTQDHVSRHLGQLDVTRIVVAHRLSTIRRADQILVLDRGRIVQRGGFDELAAVEGPFRQLVSRQLA